MQGKSHWKHVLASTLVIIVVSVGMWFLLGAKCVAAVAAQPSVLIPLPFLLFVAYILMALLHHLCRIIVGKMVGMRLLTFSAGPFAIRRTRDGLRPVWNERHPAILMGSTAFAPIGLGRLGRGHSSATASAGPALPHHLLDGARGRCLRHELTS